VDTTIVNRLVSVFTPFLIAVLQNHHFNRDIPDLVIQHYPGVDAGGSYPDARPWIAVQTVVVNRSRARSIAELVFSRFKRIFFKCLLISQAGLQFRQIDIVLIFAIVEYLLIVYLPVILQPAVKSFIALPFVNINRSRIAR